MYFYIDESGHTGPNLFDSTQPTLYYGVLSSKFNVNILATERLNLLKRKLGIERLHAAELGNEGLVKIINDICDIQKKLDIRFDLYKVEKKDHAVISFFDQVFDAGLNPAVTWSGYWTPLRYILLLKVASLFDEEVAKKAWEARIELDDLKSEAILVDICKLLKTRTCLLPDARSRELISDALTWAQKNPKEIYYNTKNKNDRLAAMPNIIGFQSVMHGIALRLNKCNRNALQITVDQQSQFNKAQRTLSDFFASVRDMPCINGPGLPEINYKGMPNIPITFSSSKNNSGLELVDINLWILKRFIENKELATELHSLIKQHLIRGLSDEISLSAIDARWKPWFEALPEPTKEQSEKAAQIHDLEEVRRRAAIKNHE